MSMKTARKQTIKKSKLTIKLKGKEIILSLKMRKVK